MDHVAILRKGEHILEDILSGKKSIESRWYVNKVAPWNKIQTGDTVFLKETGEKVTAKATVKKVYQFDNLDEIKTRTIIHNFGQQISPRGTQAEWDIWLKNKGFKNYCVLIELNSVEKVEPFAINKKGFGISSTWLVVGNIQHVKK